MDFCNRLLEDIQFAEAQVEQAAAALKNVQLQLDNTRILAPVAGIVAVKSVEPGEIISSGQPLFLITNPSDVWIAANIEETYIGKIKIDQPARFTIDAYPGVKFQGQVSEIGAAAGSQFTLLPAENSSGNFTKVTQRIPVKIKPSDVEPNILKPGMSAVIDIDIK